MSSQQTVVRCSFQIFVLRKGRFTIYLNDCRRKRADNFSKLSTIYDLNFGYNMILCGVCVMGCVGVGCVCVCVCVGGCVCVCVVRVCVGVCVGNNFESKLYFFLNL